MKKIIALILATLMVMCALAACGNTATSGTTAGTTAGGTTAGTTAGTQPTNPPTSATTATTEVPKPVEPYTTLCYLPTGEGAKAVEVRTAKEVGTLTAGEGVELKGGYFYVVTVDAAANKNTATKEVGAAVTDKKVTAGWTNVKSSGSVMSNGSYWIKPTGATMRTWNFNNFMDVTAFNTALEGVNIGNFGTITFKLVDGDISTVVFNNEESEESLTDYPNWNFVYVGYKGNSLAAATGKTFSGLAMNAKDLIYTAIDKTFEQEIGTLRELWVKSMDTYGGLPSVLTDNGKWNGTTQQTANCNAFTGKLVPSLYDSYLASYNKLLDAGKTEASITAALEAANAALDAAKAAYDAAVAANADVKALNDAYVAAAAALEEAKQAEYEAKAAYETAKAQSGESSDQAKALKPAYDEATAAKNTAQTANDTAKAALDAAVEADANLKALAAELVVKADDGFDSKADIQKAANSDKTAVDNYKKFSELYAKFTAAYAELANVALWDVKDMDNSPINKLYAGVENVSLPTFTYYYDAETDTYTVFVTSMTAKNFVVEWLDKNPVKD